jgi:DNA-directed RNA polymerase specialized sigma24 family protein
MRVESTLDQLVELASEGDKEALEAIIIGIQERIYNLALRMLWHPSDAEDATQEIFRNIPQKLVHERGKTRNASQAKEYSQ